MKKITVLLLGCFIMFAAKAQDPKQKIERACLDYIEGFYEGDTTKLIGCLNPALYKFGYWQDKKTGNYAPDGNMTGDRPLIMQNGCMKKRILQKQLHQKKLRYWM